MERFTASGNPQQQRPCTFFHTNINSIPFSPKPRQQPSEPHFTFNLRRLPEDTELSIFDAERYFNGVQHQTEGRRQNKGLWRRQQHAGMSSEDPSAGPVPVAAKTCAFNKQRWRPSSTCPWPLRRSCPCFRRKAVEVEQKCPAPRNPDHLDLHGIGSASLYKESKAAGEGTCYSTAAAAGGTRPGAAPMENELSLEVEKMAKFTLVPESWIDERDLFLGSSLLLRDEVVQPFSDGRRTFPAPARTSSPPDEPSRYSLEVFQPAEESSTTPGGSLEFRRRAMKPLFPGDGLTRRSFTFPASPVARVASVEEELASDSSSDLFEIESFSTQTTPSRPSHTRGGFGDKAATTPRTIPPPGDASAGRTNWARASSGPPLPAHSHVSASPAGAAGDGAGV